MATKQSYELQRAALNDVINYLQRVYIPDNLIILKKYDNHIEKLRDAELFSDFFPGFTDLRGYFKKYINELNDEAYRHIKVLNKQCTHLDQLISSWSSSPNRNN